MPKVGGKKFPYTADGMERAAKAASKPSKMRDLPRRKPSKKAALPMYGKMSKKGPK